MLRFNNQSLAIIPRTQAVNIPTPLDKNIPPGGLKKFKFALNKDVPPSLPTNTYVQPDGVSLYFQPDGISLYFQPPTPPTPPAISYIYTVTSADLQSIGYGEGDYRMIYQYFTVTNGSMGPFTGPWGIALGWRGTFEVIQEVQIIM